VTPKERWLAVLRRQTPDRVPMDYWGTPETTARLQQHLGCADEWALMEALDIDRVLKVVPPYVGPPLPPDTDHFGCRFQTVPHAGGAYEECVHHPLAGLDTIQAVEESYVWPQADWFDHASLPEQIRGREHYPIRGGGSEPFLRYTQLRGLEQAYLDLLLHPGLVHHCLDRLFDLCHEQTRRIYEALPGQVDLSYVSEDLGGQDQLLFSPAQIREFLFPRMRRMIDLAHDHGVHVFHHDDGAIRPVIGELIDLGIDVLNPIQWRCPGMDRAELKAAFGARVVFHGGVDNQQTLAFGTVEDVVAEVRTNLEVLGAGGGYILAPCHNIQALTPPENVVALYRTGSELGRRRS
jgi:uroporphyrinogen decarboxylase